jgi:hypothetical protein
VTLQLTAPALRRVADALDRLADVEGFTGIRVDGGQYGHALVSINADGEDGPADEALRVVRTDAATDGTPIYAIEVEVP